MAGNEPLLIACRQGPTVSVNLQVPVGTKASGLQQLLAAANGVDVSNDVTIKVKTGTTGLSCFKNSVLTAVALFAALGAARH